MNRRQNSDTRRWSKDRNQRDVDLSVDELGDESDSGLLGLFEPEHSKQPSMADKRKLDEYKKQNSQDNFVLMEGALTKRGSMFPSWKERYFVLESRGRLTYYNSEDESSRASNALGSIPICVGTTITQPPADKSTFEIRVPPNPNHKGRMFLLSADTHEAASTWAATLQQVQQRVLYVSFPAGLRHW
mmetsp:Transcript_8330/g.24744  ORF Transcript_8330/g.24744 Transcript_8330/m.24744 type:complete len:187 (-) Transcript_8330:104-664(-)